MPEIIEYSDELTHYGRLGMKWGQHIFTDSDPKSSIGSSKQKKPQQSKKKSRVTRKKYITDDGKGVFIREGEKIEAHTYSYPGGWVPEDVADSVWENLPDEVKELFDKINDSWDESSEELSEKFEKATGINIGDVTLAYAIIEANKNNPSAFKKNSNMEEALSWAIYIREDLRNVLNERVGHR